METCLHSEAQERNLALMFLHYICLYTCFVISDL